MVVAFFPPVYLLKHSPWLRHVQDSISTGVFEWMSDSMTCQSGFPIPFFTCYSKRIESSQRRKQIKAQTRVLWRTKAFSVYWKTAFKDKKKEKRARWHLHIIRSLSVWEWLHGGPTVCPCQKQPVAIIQRQQSQRTKTHPRINRNQKTHTHKRWLGMGWLDSLLCEKIGCLGFPWRSGM